MNVGVSLTMEVEQVGEHLRLQAATVLTALLNEFSAITDYRTLRDGLPRRLAHLLKCRCVLLYQYIGTTLQFVAGSFDDVPGWSTSLLAVAHINPIELNSELPEARAWRTRHATTEPLEGLTPQLAAVPLIYRQRAIGVLVAYRKQMELAGTIYEAGRPPARGATRSDAAYWTNDELPVLEAVAGVIALLLENNRLLEHDNQRIHELSLLNKIASQLNFSIYEAERLYTIVTQHAKEITAADRCELVTPHALAAASSWITPALQALLFARFNQNRGSHLMPLIVERPGDEHTLEYLNHMSPNIKTFFAIPLLARESSQQRNGYRGGLLASPLQGREIVQGGLVGEENLQAMPLYGRTDVHEARVLAIIVGGYHRAYKLHREEVLLLQVLANQAGAVLENMHLMTEVVEARNEARKLLRQVLDDQRLKELILESVPSGLITVDLAWRITTYNRAAEAILGYLAFEALDQPLQKILRVSLPLGSSAHEGAFPSQYATEQNITTGRPREASPSEENLVTVDRHGQEVVLDVHRAPLYNDRRVHIGWLITFVDVTSVHHLEEEKRRLDRLVSLGEMAASVAHEVRNPLASIKTSMQMLKDDLHEYEQVPEEVQESVAVALKEVERLDAIVRDLLLFARPRQLHRVQCNLVDLSDHVLHMLRQQYTELGIEVHRVYHDVPLIYVDMAQMEQVLFNLYMNAIQAMPDGGVLTISCQVVPASPIAPKSIIQEKRALLALSEPIGVYNDQQNWLELLVSDTGIGMATDQLEHIFQPFFTTKAHGIGLGLPITRRLVEDHRGHLSVRSQLGYGTTITVRLPIEDVSP